MRKNYSKSIFFLLIVFTSFLGLYNCNSGSNSNEETKSKKDLLNEKTLTNLQNLFNLSDSLIGNGYGQPININWITSCQSEFTSVMKNYGFDQTASTAPIARTNPTRMVTQSVSFKGKGLFDWLTHIPITDSENTHLRITFGIYTGEFLDSVGASHDDSLKLVNRITTFLVPYNESTNSVVGTSAYDLGGLHP